jgi:hypothetical protein
MALVANTFTAPAHWASALINGDRTGLSEDDEQALDDYLAQHPQHASPAGCGDTFFSRFDGLLTEVCTFTYLTRTE